MIKNIKIFIYLFSIFSLLFSEDRIITSSDIKDKFSIYSRELKNIEDKLEVSNSTDTKNPFIAFALSAIIPGTGQIYNGDYKRGGIYLAIELLTWSYHLNYKDKSDYYERIYKEYANEHWSFDKWISDYCLFADPEHPVHETMINIDLNRFFYPWDDSHYIEFIDNESINFTNTTAFENDYKNVNVCFDAFDNNGQCVTDFFNDSEVVLNHHLYEGLGKYELFFAGWDDTHLCDEPNNGDCSWILENGNTGNAFTNNKYFYQNTLRRKQNKKSDYAENALTLIFVNHAASMFDSFLSNIIKSNNFNFNYITQPMYTYDSNLELKGLNLSILW